MSSSCPAIAAAALRRSCFPRSKPSPANAAPASSRSKCWTVMRPHATCTGGWGLLPTGLTPPWATRSSCRNGWTEARAGRADAGVGRVAAASSMERCATRRAHHAAGRGLRRQCRRHAILGKREIRRRARPGTATPCAFAAVAAFPRQRGSLRTSRRCRWMVNSGSGAAASMRCRARCVDVNPWMPNGDRCVIWFSNCPARVADRAALMKQFNAVVRAGGEGLMLHRADAPYLTGRSEVLLKLKPWLDAEAVVVGHIPGKGKYQGLTGALLMEMPDTLPPR